MRTAWVAGTNTSSVTIVLLPVARMPLVSHVSRTLYLPGGMRNNTQSGAGPSCSKPPTIDPGAVINPARKRGLVAGDAETVAVACDACGRQDRSRDWHVGTIGPHRLLGLLRKLADHVRVMDEQARTPAMRCVGGADLAHDLEPGVEPEPVTTEASRNQDARQARVDELGNRLGRHPPRLLGSGGPGTQAGNEGTGAGNDLVAGDGAQRVRAHAMLLPTRVLVCGTLAFGGMVRKPVAAFWFTATSTAPRALPEKMRSRSAASIGSALIAAIVLLIRILPCSGSNGASVANRQCAVPKYV